MVSDVVFAIAPGTPCVHKVNMVCDLIFAATLSDIPCLHKVITVSDVTSTATLSSSLFVT